MLCRIVREHQIQDGLVLVPLAGSGELGHHGLDYPVGALYRITLRRVRQCWLVNDNELLLGGISRFQISFR